MKLQNKSDRIFKWSMQHHTCPIDWLTIIEISHERHCISNCWQHECLLNRLFIQTNPSKHFHWNKPPVMRESPHRRETFPCHNIIMSNHCLGTLPSKHQSNHRTINSLRPRQMDAILQTPFSNAFSCMKMFEFRLKFHWSLFPRVHVTIFQHWFWSWLGAVQATSHYLNQWWFVYWRIYASLGLNELNNMVLI